MPLNQPASLPSAESSASFWHTEPSSLLLGHRSTRELPREADVVVVGSGVSGAGVVWHMLRDEKGNTRSKEEEGKEKKIVVLEAREVCWGATGRNGGHCQPIPYEHPSDPSIGSFELQNYSALKSLISTLSIPCEFNPQSGIRGLYSSSDLEHAKLSFSILQSTDPSLASHVKIVEDKAELEKLRIPTAAGAAVMDVAARLWPYKFVAHIFEALVLNKELNLQTHTPATSLAHLQDGTWEVTTPRGVIITKNVVLATNAYTSHLLPEFTDLIVPARGQMSALIPPTALAGKNRLQDSYGFIGPKQDDYLIQRPPGTAEHLMYGGGRSNGPSLGETDDVFVDKNVGAYLRKALITLMGAEGEDKEFEATHEWTGIMGFSRDNVPWVGGVPGKEGVWVVAGYTGHGMPNAWLCGRAIAEMLGRRFEGVGVEEAVQAAVKGGLPKAYVVDEGRVLKARQLDSVEVQDLDHGFKAEFVE